MSDSGDVQEPKGMPGGEGLKSLPPEIRGLSTPESGSETMHGEVEDLTSATERIAPEDQIQIPGLLLSILVLVGLLASLGVVHYRKHEK